MKLKIRTNTIAGLWVGFFVSDPQIAQITQIEANDNCGKQRVEIIMKTVFWLGLLFLVLPNVAMGELVKGIYGVPSIKERDPLSYVADMEKAGVNAVFVKPDRDTVKWFKDRGFKVFVSVDAYGGSGAWKRFPDSRPVLADGSLLGENREYACHGGACPSHEGWRSERLSVIGGLIKDFEAQGLPLDGIWLDYIRYPGRWSVLDPKVPDTCYCGRCLEAFSKDSGIQVPGGVSTEESFRWIKEHCAYEWMRWKKEQISGFVWDVRKILDEYPDVRSQRSEIGYQRTESASLETASFTHLGPGLFWINHYCIN